MSSDQTADELDPDLRPRKPNVHAVDILGVMAGAVPFALSYATTTSSYSSSSGGTFEVGTVTKSHMDYVALGGGGVAVICAIVGLALLLVGLPFTTEAGVATLPILLRPHAI